MGSESFKNANYLCFRESEIKNEEGLCEKMIKVEKLSKSKYRNLTISSLNQEVKPKKR